MKSRLGGETNCVQMHLCFTSAANDFCAFRLHCLWQHFQMKLLLLFSPGHFSWHFEQKKKKNTSRRFIVTFNEPGAGRPTTSFWQFVHQFLPLDFLIHLMQIFLLITIRIMWHCSENIVLFYILRGSLVVLLPDFFFVLPLLLHPPKTLCKFFFSLFFRIFKRRRGRGGCWRSLEMVLYRPSVITSGALSCCCFLLSPTSLPILTSDLGLPPPHNLPLTRHILFLGPPSAGWELLKSHFSPGLLLTLNLRRTLFATSTRPNKLDGCHVLCS